MIASGGLGAGDVFVSDFTSAELAVSFEGAAVGVDTDEDLVCDVLLCDVLRAGFS